MNYRKIIMPLFLAIFAFIALDCDKNKLDLEGIIASQSGSDAGKIGDTVYVKMKDDWTGFDHPMDIIVGTEDNTIYVADTYNDRIVMMNVAGQIESIRSVKHPTALGIDHLQNLIVCAQMETIIQGKTETVSAVYKFDIRAAGGQIANAPMSRILPTNNDLRFIDEVRRREYTGVCVFADNSFYISRKGSVNQGTYDPDNSILIFQKTVSKEDTLIGPVPNITADGTGLLSANNISSLTSFKGQGMDILVTLIGQNSFKTQWLQFVSTNTYTGYINKLEPSNARMMAVNRFQQPEDAAVDESGNIFIADAAKDSIFKFSRYGEELESFGGSSVFKHPYAVAVYNKVVYVADTDNNRILRFQLSTDAESK
ncbi:MAG: hypothetical protein HF314_00325 [Ignavibacteria bacterium]|jgi:DNA-binding beta-propeller fold protein YncE|nr:hypothetical protein [Ignavibacteria bacterium]MCU7501496.1 hypothetical protein [Ignavibacteria bacterium]MCU7515988.1 hypothetical protein [Ignavibacteria bacterium]